jgi:hypothetical protein
VATPTAVVDAAEAVLRAAAEVVDNAVIEIPELGAGETIAAKAIPGWAGLVAAGAYFLGTIPTRPEGAAQSDIDVYRGVAHALDTAITYLNTHDLTGPALRGQIEAIRMLTADVRQLRDHFAHIASQQGSSSSPGPDVMPSPQAVSRADLERLRSATARIAVWQRTHHRDVHQELAIAQARANAGAVAIGAAGVTQATATVTAIRYILEHAIPDAVHELTTLVRAERDLRRDADQEIRTRFAAAVDDVTKRIGDLVRWLRTEALPDLEEQIKAERAARKDADQQLHRGIATETDARAGTDAELLAMVAPLLQWASSFGTHTTEKVKRHEDQIDALDRFDWSMLLAFTGFPALTALVTKLLPKVAEASPEVLTGLEGAAARLLGEL